MTGISDSRFAALPAVRVLPNGGEILCALFLVLLLRPSFGYAQSMPPTEPPPLTFRGYIAGASLRDMTAATLRLKGPSLRCIRSRADASVQECRTTFTDRATGAAVEVWLSAIDSLTGILSLKADGSGALEAWRTELRTRYGAVETKLQGPQRMMQWVRRGRMIRLTWRVDGPRPTVSLTLVDGRVLDNWGRKRQQ